MGGRQRFGAGVGKQDKCSSSKTKNNLHGIVWNGWLLNFGGSIGWNKRNKVHCFASVCCQWATITDGFSLTWYITKLMAVSVYGFHFALN